MTKSSYTNTNILEIGDLVVEEGEGGIDLSQFQDSNTRKIWIMGEITQESIYHAKRIIEINNEDEDEGIPVEEREPIIIYLSCDGGDVGIGLAIADVIQNSKTPVYGITVSHAFSMGCCIAVSCHKRFCYQNSTFLIHDGSGGIQNSISKIKDFMKVIDLNERAFEKLFLGRTKINKSVYRKNYTRDWYIGAEEALKLGLVDEIIK